MYVNFVVETEFGTVACTATSGDHISIHAGSNGRNRLTFRGTEFPSSKPPTLRRFREHLRQRAQAAFDAAHPNEEVPS